MNAARRTVVSHHNQKTIMLSHEQFLESIVTMLAVDGKIDELEHDFLRRIAQQFAVPFSTINETLHKISFGKYLVHIPEHPFTKRKLYALLVQAALANHVLVSQEQQLLHKVAEKMGVSKIEAQKMLWIEQQKKNA